MKKKKLGQIFGSCIGTGQFRPSIAVPIHSDIVHCSVDVNENLKKCVGPTWVNIDDELKA